MNAEKNEYVFPSQYNPRSGAAMPGVTLRDYMAIKASDADVNAIIGEHGTLAEPASVNKAQKYTYSITRQQARYIHADRMLEARR